MSVDNLVLDDDLEYNEDNKMTNWKNNFPNIKIDRILNIDTNKIKDLNTVENYGRFVDFKNEINDYIMNLFSDELLDKTEDFKLAFSQWNIAKVSDDLVEEKQLLMLLLKEKNSIYNQILLQSIILWKLDNILSVDEKNDVKIILKSWVLSYFDDIYINRLNQIKNTDNSILEIETKYNNPIYWWLLNRKIRWYGDFCLDKDLKIDDKDFSNIKDENIKKYLLMLDAFLKWWITDYNLWVETELYETKTWKNNNSALWIITPMENYNNKSFVEPEFIFFLKDKENIFNYSDFFTLSEKYFDSKYEMDKMTCNFVETFLEWWESTYSWFIGKAFPNDQSLSQREWKSIILKNNNMYTVIINANNWFKKLFWEDYLFDNEIIYNELLKEVTYHEFWHSLFKDWYNNSKLEESKATLFYYLQIFDENNKKEYTESDIKRIIDFTIVDSIRNLERIDQEKFEKYTILTKVNLMWLFSSGLVYFDDNNILQTNIDQEKFKLFLSSLKDVLFFIKKHYENKDKESFEKEEQEFLVKIEKQTDSIIKKICLIIE